MIAGPTMVAGRAHDIILVTRPADRAEESAARLRALGHAVLIDPMLRVEPVDPPPPPIADRTEPAQGLIFTSATGVGRYRALGGPTDRVVWAIGARTAQAALAAGFTRVETADGHGRDLADRMLAAIDPEAGALLWPCGEDVAVDLPDLLAPAGIAVERLVLYRTVAADGFTAETEQALRSASVRAVLFYSPKTASVFAGLAGARPALASALASTRALCLSQAVADALPDGLFARLEVASAPSEDALLALIDAVETTPEATGAGAEAGERPMSDKDARTPSGETPEGLEPMAGAEQTAPSIPVDDIVERFGGLRPMAAKLDVAVSTIQGWKQRGHIPEARWPDVLAAAAREGIALDQPASAPGASPWTKAEPEAPEQTAEGRPASEDEAAPTLPDDKPGAAPKTGDVVDLRASAPDATEPPVQETESRTEAAPPPPPLAAHPPQSARSGGRGVAWLALLVGLTALAGAATRPAWAPIADPVLARYLPLPPSAPVQAEDPRVAALQDRLAALGDRLATLENRPEATQGPGPDALAGLESRLGGLEGRLDAVDDALSALRDAPAPEAGLDPAALDPIRAALDTLRAELGTLTDRVAEQAQLTDHLGAVESALDTAASERAALAERIDSVLAEVAARADAMADAGGRAAALALSIGALEEALASPDGAVEEAVQRLRLIAGGDEAVSALLQRLEPWLAAPVPTLGELRARFAAIAPELARPAVETGAGGFADSVVGNLFGVISVRRVGETEDLPPEARAEALLAEGDLAGAVAALAGLGEPAAGWVRLAEGRLRIDAALADLRGLALDRLARVGAGAGAPPAEESTPSTGEARP